MPRRALPKPACEAMGMPCREAAICASTRSRRTRSTSGIARRQSRRARRIDPPHLGRPGQGHALAACQVFNPHSATAVPAVQSNGIFCLPAAGHHCHVDRRLHAASARQKTLFIINSKSFEQLLARATSPQLSLTRNRPANMLRRVRPAFQAERVSLSIFFGRAAPTVVDAARGSRMNLRHWFQIQVLLGLALYGSTRLSRSLLDHPTLPHFWLSNAKQCGHLPSSMESGVAQRP